VADLPGAIWPVCTTPDGVWRASACVIEPLLVTLIVTGPVFETLALAGVILNSLSVRLTLPAPVLVGADAAVELVEPAAELLDAAGELLLLLAEPQPAISAAAAKGATNARRLIRVSDAWGCDFQDAARA
jgi:hypothetical protein